MLSLVFQWANVNEMSFGINKSTIVVKPINFNKPPRYEDPTFYIGMYSIPEVTCYTYLGIPFDEDLSLKPILSNMYKKVNNSLYSLRNFLLNNSIPIGLKKLKKKNIKNTDEIKEEYWLNNPLNNGRKPLDIPISNSKIKQKLLILVLKNLI